MMKKTRRKAGLRKESVLRYRHPDKKTGSKPPED